MAEATIFTASEENASANVCCILISFNPDIDHLAKAIESLSTKINTIIVDNASDGRNLEQLEKIAASSSSVHLLSLSSNKGIAAAQNCGINYIDENFRSCQYILFLDHDSLLPAQSIFDLVSIHESISARGEKVAAVGPLLFEPRGDKIFPFHKVGWLGLGREIRLESKQPTEVFSLNSSGTLVSRSVLNESCRLNEEMFIDHVDTEWCFRVRSKGYKLFGTGAVQMQHEMGADICRYWLFGWKTMPYRSPLRHYYLFRNSLYIQRKSYVPLYWKLQNILKLLFTASYFTLFTKENSQQLHFILQGVKDGLKGRMGSFGQNN